MKLQNKFALCEFLVTCIHDFRAHTIFLRLKLKEFRKFDSAATALEEVSAIVEGKVSSRLAALLDTIKDEKKASLAVADPKLGIQYLFQKGLKTNNE